jgi:hypothetical protein
MVRRDGASALGDDGVRHADLVAHVLHVIDDVVGVFLQGIVDAGFEIGLRAVVVDAQAAAHVQILQAGAGARQVDVHADGFVHRGLDLPDIGDLAAQVEVQQVQAIGHAGVAQFLQGAHRLRDRRVQTSSDSRPRTSSGPNRGCLEQNLKLAANVNPLPAAPVYTRRRPVCGRRFA